MAEMFVLALSAVVLVLAMARCANCAEYLNSTIDFAKMVDDFSSSQTPSRRTNRNGRLISFDTRNDNIEVGLEFAIPFLSIPVKRSVNTMKSWASDTASYVANPVMNVNGGAIGLTITVALAGLATTVIWRTLMKDQVANMNRMHNGWKSSKIIEMRKYSPTKMDTMWLMGKNVQISFVSGAHKRMDEPHSLFPFIDVLEKTLHKYDIDAIGCMQTVLCTFAQHAMDNVSKGNGTNAEKIFDGVVRTWLLKELTAGTAINDAIIAGHQSTECRTRFSACQIKSKQIHRVIESILHHIKLNYA